MGTKIKTAREIQSMREAGRILAQVLQVARTHTLPGTATQEIADVVKSELKGYGAQPSFLGYQGFPSVICVSINDEVVHGIPSPTRIIQEGDIVGLDLGVTYRGMITDGAISTIAGKPKYPADPELLKVTERALRAGINVLHDKVRTGDIGAAIQAVLEAHKYGIVRDLVGHGVGHHLHEDPNIPNYGRPNSGPWLDAGMTIAIEPMATLGTDQVWLADDGWTIKTADDSRSAHFEHTILILANGAEILTQP